MNSIDELSTVGRGWLVGLVTTVVLTTAGCSYVEQFFVINASSAPLRVLAEASSLHNANTGERVCSFVGQGKRLAVVPADRVRREYIGFDELSKATDATFDHAECSVRVTVSPRTALLLWSTSNGMRSQFLTKIVLVDQHGQQKVFEGSDVAARFHKRSTAVYVIEHR